MSHNVDKNEVFEFLRIASLDVHNLEAQTEAYWIIVYMFVKKTLKIDIVEAFKTTTVNSKMSAMLDEVDLNAFDFQHGFLNHKGRKINLQAFVPVADLEYAKKERYLAENNMHNLTNVIRRKSEMGVFSDYPHYYKIEHEGKQAQAAEGFLFGTRPSENGNFIISRTEDVFC